MQPMNGPENGYTDNRTLVLIKPDGVSRRLIGSIIGRYEQAGLRVENIRMLLIDRPLAEAHYREHKEKPFFPKLMEYITSGPSVIMILTGENAVSTIRELNEEIRRAYSMDMTRNTVHGSDSPESAGREIEIFFG